MKVTTVISWVAAFVMVMAVSACRITRNHAVGLNEINNHVDSTATAVLGDSIFTIITEANKVTVSNKSLSMPSDAPRDIVLKKDAVKALCFLISDPANYESNTPVYGLFNPSVTYNFKKGKKSVSLAYDFGLGKWSVRSADGSDLIVRDLKNGSEILMFSRTLFPSDPLLKSIENTL